MKRKKLKKGIIYPPIAIQVGGRVKKCPAGIMDWIDNMGEEVIYGFSRVNIFRR